MVVVTGGATAGGTIAFVPNDAAHDGAWTAGVTPGNVVVGNALGAAPPRNVGDDPIVPVVAPDPADGAIYPGTELPADPGPAASVERNPCNQIQP
jgi:hypothetical protein